MNLINIFCQCMGQAPAGANGAAPQGGGAMTWVFLLLLIVVFYFFMIRPQSKKAKEERKFRESLKKGDHVLVLGSIHAKILEIQDTTFIVEVEGQGKLKVEKGAVNPAPSEAK
ncbi:MAG: preprotein translocase subunit YajC [Bacteroidales bacterium]|nr:preprotein translocase subunit YajC [Bacteroidales bacterium]